MSDKLTVLGSSSQGNGYLLEVGEDKLILECGVPAKEMLQLLDWKPQGVFALVSHCHSDHSKYIKQYQKFGINVYSNSDVAEKFERAKVLQPMKRYKIGNFQVLPLEVPHGDCPNYAYHLALPDGQTLLFATDLTDFPYNIPNCNYICIEANWSEDLLIDRIVNNEEARSSAQTHLELKQCMTLINRLKSAYLNKVVLLHLSAGNSNENAFIQEIKYHCGIDCVDVADRNKTFDLKPDF